MSAESIKAEEKTLLAMHHKRKSKGKGRIEAADGQMRNCVWTEYFNGKDSIGKVTTCKPDFKSVTIAEKGKTITRYSSDGDDIPDGTTQEIGGQDNQKMLSKMR